MNQIESEVTNYTDRLQVAFDSQSDKPAFATKTGPAWQDKLKQGQYPTRHIERLESKIFGPGSEMCDSMWPKVQTGDCILILAGTRGAGKTLIATEWAKRRSEDGKSAGRYAKCADIISDIKATWHDGGKSIGTEQDVLRRYRTAKYLVIDEFHERGASEWEARTLINILDHRYDAMLATVLIANLSLTEVQQNINPSILDRANETGGLVVCDWPSYRK